MMKQTLLETVLEQLGTYLPDPTEDGTLEDDRVMSLIYPSPDAAGNAEKFDLVRKNLLQELEDEARGPAGMRDRIRSIVTSLDQSDLPPGGFAVFTNGEDTNYFALQQRPYPRMRLGGAALALPVLADAHLSSRFWLAILDVEQPRLFHVSDGYLHDKTPSEVQTLTSTMEQYHPMDAVVFHSSGSVRRSGAPAKFHALGTATEDLRKDEITRVLAAFGRQVGDIVTGSDPLVLAGGPSRIGHFRESFSHQNLLEHDLKAAGEGLELDGLLKDAADVVEEHLRETSRKTLEDVDPSSALRSAAEIVPAAIQGRVDTVLIHPDHCGFLQGDDERLKLGEDPDPRFAERSKAVAYALRNGARLMITREHTGDGPLATTRF
ncbi:baeRF3 domain-containing protein [Parvularcula maris]|nr:hypothetical protein [Parvularcula maris]